ncbi:hypothetical protein [Seonamhaeicola maritimus]|uniref:Outer membrane beta-barrel protein n=1 Tax=Seonamhaeicola maritimus TaxID=2591822 RepID=A0A5C7GME8_9FLAO|nr:hypothetical protein [Seonamhaeicola maritimus]TXG39709.1 hypothetical protein FUA22_07540 [Seonamhaeicola maritimus]
MGNKTIIISIMLLIPMFLMAQEKDSKFKLKFSGFISNDASLNTRQSISARGEGLFVLAPKPVELDNEGNDINNTPSFNFVGINSRIRVKITGPDAFGAKTSGMIEGDFLGVNTDSKFNFRLRHAFMKLDWEKSQLLVGQYWHPTFVVDCYPGTVSFGAGSPFNPLARNPQFRYSYKLGKTTISLTQLTNGHFTNKGAADAQFNSLVPELHFQLQYKADKFVGGLGYGHQILRPEIVTANNYITKEKVHSNTVLAFAKVTSSMLTLKSYSMYGQNNDNLVMMGGYAAVEKTYTSDQINKGIVEYTPYNNFTSWLDIHTNGKKIIAGIFGGYSKNLGASKNVDISTYTGRWGNVKDMMRISPRLIFISGSTIIGTEIEYSSVNYNKGNPDGLTDEEITGYNSKGLVTNYEAANNLKFLLNVTYKF